MGTGLHMLKVTNEQTFLYKCLLVFVIAVHVILFKSLVVHCCLIYLWDIIPFLLLKVSYVLWFPFSKVGSITFLSVKRKKNNLENNTDYPILTKTKFELAQHIGFHQCSFFREGIFYIFPLGPLLKLCRAVAVILGFLVNINKIFLQNLPMIIHVQYGFISSVVFVDGICNMFL